MHSLSYIWAKTLAALEQRLTETVVNEWMEDAHALELTPERLVLYSPDEFRAATIANSYGPHIRDILKNLLGHEIEFEVWDDARLQQHRRADATGGAVYVNPAFTFDQFISGDANMAAVNSARLAAQQPGLETNNPLFLYGPPGVGKTHLLYAIINDVVAHSPEKKIVYVRADQFVNELVTAILHGNTAQFKQKYRQADILLVDDIEFIAGKESTQEEFVHTFNELFEHQKQIVITADRPPEAMATMEDRLKSRFGYGVLIGIRPPDAKTRLAITRAKAARYRLSLEEDALHFISDTLPGSVRQIEGALKTIRAFHALSGAKLTLEQIRSTVEDIAAQELKHPVTAAQVVRHTCKYYGFTEEQLKSPQRGKNITQARQMAMYLVRDLTKMSFPEIAKLFSRDHSTVQHSVRKIEDALIEQDPQITQTVENIIASIQNSG